MNKNTLLLGASLAFFSVSAIASQLDIAMSQASDSGLSPHDMVTTETQPIFIGKARPSSTVELALNGMKVEKKVSSAGTFLWQPAPLLDGEYQLTVTDGGDFTWTTFVVDTTTFIDYEQRVDGGNYILSGRAESHAQISASISNYEYTALVSSNGEWQIPLSTQDVSQDDLVELTIVDIAGNSQMEMFQVNLGTAPHDLTASLSASSDSGVQYDNVTSQSSNIEFTGNTTPFSTVTFNLGGLTEKLKAESDGSWLAAFKGYLLDGDYRWSVDAVAPNGDIAFYYESITIDTIVDGFSITPSTGITDKGTAVISGVVSEPVTINVTVNNKTYTTHTSSDWSVKVVGLDSSQSYQMTISASDHAGNMDFASEQLLPMN